MAAMNATPRKNSGTWTRRCLSLETTINVRASLARRSSDSRGLRTRSTAATEVDRCRDLSQGIVGIVRGVESCWRESDAGPG